MNQLKPSGGFPFYYWFLAGLLVGVLTGWFFHGTINFLLRMIVLIGFVIIVGMVIYFWQKGGRSRKSSTSKDDIPDGTWRNIDPSGRK